MAFLREFYYSRFQNIHFFLFVAVNLKIVPWLHPKVAREISCLFLPVKGPEITDEIYFRTVM